MTQAVEVVPGEAKPSLALRLRGEQASVEVVPGEA